jgi:NAD(P)-dependent dehydrogenase (short-subunit alcohol dehydrogenase family)
MEQMTTKTAVIIGVGPENGVGASLCTRFARADLHVFVAGRTLAKVEVVAQAIRNAGGLATAVEADTTDEQAVIALFAAAAAAGPVHLSIFNAGNNMPGDFLTMGAAYFEQCWRIACYGGFLFSREALRHMVPNGEGTLLFTGASASMRGKPNFAAFTSAKGGLRNLAQSLAREFGPKNIHVGHIVIDGAVDGDRIRIGRPEVAKLYGDARLVDIPGIVDAYEYMYRQPNRAWSHEIDIRSAVEEF